MSGQRVILKAYKEDVADMDILWIIREASVLDKCAHPCVIKLLDVMILPEHSLPSLVLEDGGDSITSLGGGCISKFDAFSSRRVLLSISSALAHMHEHGILHLVVKPDNIVGQQTLFNCPPDGFNQYTFKLADLGNAEEAPEPRLTSHLTPYTRHLPLALAHAHTDSYTHSHTHTYIRTHTYI